MQNNFGPYDAESQNIDQRRKYAEALRGQALEPIQQQTAGGYVVPISPFQGLAKMLQAYGSRRGMEMADEQKKDLMGRMDTERSTDMTALANALRGTPRTPQQFDPQEAQQSADQGTPMPYNPAVPGDPNQAAMIALQSRLPDVRQMAPGLMNIGETRLTREDNQAFRAQESALQRDQRRQDLEMRIAAEERAGRNADSLKRDLTQMRVDAQREAARDRAANRPQGQVQVVNTENGIFRVMPNGEMAPLIDPATGKTLMPKAAAGKAAKTDVDKTMDLYMAASNGLISGLSKTTTGPLAGRLPATTTQAQVGEGAVAAMAPVLKQLFRVAGEGTFTDKDQELLLNMVPTRKDTPDARKQKIANIDNIVAAKLGLPIPDRGDKEAPPSAQSSPVDALLDKYK
jgi:hypothetical protein